MIKLLVFDLGNVILPFEHRQIAFKLHEKSEKKNMLSPYHIFNFLFDREKGIVNIFETGKINSLEFFILLKEHFMLTLNFKDFKNIWNPIFHENIQVSNTILKLKSKGYPLYLLSDTNELHFNYISGKYPIVHKMDRWILSFQVGVKKPERMIYDAIFESIDVKRNEVFYIDDIERYVEAAKSFGLDGMIFQNAIDLCNVLKEKHIL